MITTLRTTKGFTMVEVMVAMAVSMIILAAVLTGSGAMLWTFRGAEHYTITSMNQMRVLDTITTDLRRAVEFQNHNLAEGADGAIVTLKLPAYYDADGTPRMPKLIKPPGRQSYEVAYGSLNETVTVVYQKTGDSIFRQRGSATPREIATGIASCRIDSASARTVTTEVTFRPRFRRFSTSDDDTRVALQATTFLRNLSN